MSHVLTCQSFVISNLDVLAETCLELGIELKLGQKTHRWWGCVVGVDTEADSATKNGIKEADLGKCEHAITVPGTDCFEIGLVKRPNGKDGEFITAFDFFGHRGEIMSARTGTKLEKLRARYTENLAVKHFNSKLKNVAGKPKWGKAVKTVLADGSIKLTAERWA